ncbi:hypothetical protein [Acanthopleuribacter pedis]|uniref:Uncharacterized protein n=1 Tax=Acanthopleuribacter pedis TaxID=442870 RepID=A0A8J7U6B0_9BACT|nr:hypothetical protein [Acanthopleuribacter pedis]MBO1320181.1 hypothetical protein [Acanthopleuribacter pedis]
MSESVLDEVVGYFRFMSRTSDALQFRRGYQLALKFCRLRRFRFVSERDFHCFLAEIELVDCPCLNYVLFWGIVRRWGFHKGFPVPDQYPRLEPRLELRCIDNQGFPHNLTLGARYRLQERAVVCEKVRVWDDNNRLRRFPIKCFDISPLVEKPRTWTIRNQAGEAVPTPHPAGMPHGPIRRLRAQAGPGQDPWIEPFIL